MCRMGWEREHTFDVVHLFESSSTLDVPAFWDGLFDTDWDSKAALARSLSFASREANSSSNSPGCIASLEADELTLKMDSRQSLATSRASGSTPGANSTALKTWLFNVRKNEWQENQISKTQSNSCASVVLIPLKSINLFRYWFSASRKSESMTDVKMWCFP